jgi:uncharacterized membrane protein YbaN (DUF454 family)
MATEIPGSRRVGNPILRGLLITAGSLSLVLGIIGIFVPLLPTTPFVLLAGWCFLRSSDRFYVWLLDHPTLGPGLKAWNEKKAIPVAAKRLAILTLSFSVLFIWTSGAPLPVKVGVTLFLVSVSVFIATRPNG